MAFASLATNTTEAFVTLATNDDYSLGALVLGYSLREATTSKKLHCMITEQVTTPVREQLQRVYDDVSIVDVLASNDEANLALIGRPDLALAFTKLNCWRLTQYSKAVFLDADTLVLRNVDELFEREEFSAAPDIGWPDFFNSGVFVYRPNEETYRALLHKATTEGSFDGADQGLLNSFFSGWREASSAFRLSFIYNVTGGIFYTYAAAYKKLRDQVKIVHFIGTQKPWRGGVGIQMPEFAQIWHRIYERHVAGTVPGSSGTETIAESRSRWEQGRPDFTGKDAFAEIQEALMKNLQ
ncbi:unnamed protein product, partial [Mesorhabditis belari]|uniref:glycogenin glucosyltransferase n=1 Tax=Mesorhabditis belari TaxID=2138241 RepID=A0AAF3ETA2_9BILA